MTDGTQGARRRPRHRREAGEDAARLRALLDAAADRYAAGRLAEACSLYLQAERLDPDDVRARYSLAVIDLRVGRHDDARRRLKAVLRRQPDLVQAHHNLGVAEQALGAWEPAAAAFGRALTLDPRSAQTRVSLAIALGVLGRTQAAIEQYRVLAEDPASRPGALTRLAVLSPGEVTPLETAALKAAAADPTLDEVTHTGLLFALGGVLEAQGDDEGAFQAFEAGNALKRRTLSQGDPGSRPAVVAREHARSVTRLRHLFTARFIAANQGEGDRTARPIFIVGMPRSGSSLIEQILASHPQVSGLGESSALWGAVEGRFPYPPDGPREADHFRRMARRYLEAQRLRGWPDRTRPTDKTLDNHLHIGLIHLMFPRATILHATRDPVDTAVACWRQLFVRGNETLYDFADIAAEWRRYQTMMDHWRQVLPGRVAEVSYEALVAEPEAQIRRLVTETCGLPWAAECLRFHESRRAVATASAGQVRQPIFNGSVARWRRHETRLAPLLEALGR